ncbi:histone deacetylase family protein [Thiohalomonas denitrificans]|uniref:Acetoin utilization deacetylase AcuC n=1 Tax=Thiohalomonas denitrificans TaxID=415747 RepID=A0A1G5QCW8_9GAMM|nr:histone deacetylase family protein [Thiohalomonas denitrificans]SCZ59693.1 Acetoin utilization deacetylase AcuC [Thiohalomonas denitrificans]
MATAYITHPDCLLHNMGDIHPEAAIRLQAIQDHLIATGLMELLHPVDAPNVTREQLERVHLPSYIDELEAIHPEGALVQLDPDTAMNEYTLAAARRAAGAVIKGTEMVIAGKVENAFCAVRPPGHHAEPGRAMGFCFFNNVAVGVAHALQALGLKRVAIVDFDVHHGNGTETIFREDERVLMASSFQHPFYPWTAIVERPNRIHVPLAAGSNGAAFREAIETSWFPALEEFAPEMIFISAGFDGHAREELGQLRLTEADFGWVTEGIVEVAHRHAGGRVVSVLEGGYVPDALARSVGHHLRALMGLND